jgi:hypothetical protein
MSVRVENSASLNFRIENLYCEVSVLEVFDTFFTNTNPLKPLSVKYV